MAIRKWSGKVTNGTKGKAGYDSTKTRSKGCHVWSGMKLGLEP